MSAARRICVNFADVKCIFCGIIVRRSFHRGFMEAEDEIARQHEARRRTDHLSKCVRAAILSSRSEMANARKNHKRTFTNTASIFFLANLRTRFKGGTTHDHDSFFLPPLSCSLPYRTLALPRVKTLNRGCHSRRKK